MTSPIKPEYPRLSPDEVYALFHGLPTELQKDQYLWGYYDRWAGRPYDRDRGPDWDRGWKACDDELADENARFHA